MSSSGLKVQKLLKNFKHYDPDERYMAVSDLARTVLQSRMPIRNETRPILDGLMELLVDPSPNVQTVAVTAFADMIPRLDAPVVYEAAVALASKLMAWESALTRSIYSVGMKTVLAAIHQSCDANEFAWVAVRIAKVVLQALPEPPPPNIDRVLRAAAQRATSVGSGGGNLSTAIQHFSSAPTVVRPESKVVDSAALHRYKLNLLNYQQQGLQLTPSLRYIAENYLAVGLELLTDVIHRSDPALFAKHHAGIVEVVKVLLDLPFEGVRFRCVSLLNELVPALTSKLVLPLIGFFSAKLDSFSQARGSEAISRVLQDGQLKTHLQILTVCCERARSAHIGPYVERVLPQVLQLCATPDTPSLLLDRAFPPVSTDGCMAVYAVDASGQSRVCAAWGLLLNVVAAILTHVIRAKRNSMLSPQQLRRCLWLALCMSSFDPVFNPDAVSDKSDRPLPDTFGSVAVSMQDVEDPQDEGKQDALEETWDNEGWSDDDELAFAEDDFAVMPVGVTNTAEGGGGQSQMLDLPDSDGGSLTVRLAALMVTKQALVLLRTEPQGSEQHDLHQSHSSTALVSLVIQHLIRRSRYERESVVKQAVWQTLGVCVDVCSERGARWQSASDDDAHGDMFVSQFDSIATSLFQSYNGLKQLSAAGVLPFNPKTSPSRHTVQVTVGSVTEALVASVADDAVTASGGNGNVIAAGVLGQRHVHLRVMHKLMTLHPQRMYAHVNRILAALHAVLMPQCKVQCRELSAERKCGENNSGGADLTECQHMHEYSGLCQYALEIVRMLILDYRCDAKSAGGQESNAHPHPPPVTQRSSSPEHGTGSAGERSSCAVAHVLHALARMLIDMAGCDALPLWAQQNSQPGVLLVGAQWESLRLQCMHLLVQRLALQGGQDSLRTARLLTRAVLAAQSVGTPFTDQCSLETVRQASYLQDPAVPVTAKTQLTHVVVEAFAQFDCCVNPQNECSDQQEPPKDQLGMVGYAQALCACMAQDSLRLMALRSLRRLSWPTALPLAMAECSAHHEITAPGCLIDSPQQTSASCPVGSKPIRDATFLRAMHEDQSFCRLHAAGLPPSGDTCSQLRHRQLWQVAQLFLEQVPKMCERKQGKDVRTQLEVMSTGVALLQAAVEAGQGIRGAPGPSSPAQKGGSGELEQGEGGGGEGRLVSGPQQVACVSRALAAWCSMAMALPTFKTAHANLGSEADVDVARRLLSVLLVVLAGPMGAVLMRSWLCTQDATWSLEPLARFAYRTLAAVTGMAADDPKAAAVQACVLADPCHPARRMQTRGPEFQNLQTTYLLASQLNFHINWCIARIFVDDSFSQQSIGLEEGMATVFREMLRAAGVKVDGDHGERKHDRQEREESHRSTTREQPLGGGGGLCPRTLGALLASGTHAFARSCQVGMLEGSVVTQLLKMCRQRIQGLPVEKPVTRCRISTMLCETAARLPVCVNIYLMGYLSLGQRDYQGSVGTDLWTQACGWLRAATSSQTHYEGDQQQSEDGWWASRSSTQLKGICTALHFLLSRCSVYQWVQTHLTRPHLCSAGRSGGGSGAQLRGSKGAGCPCECRWFLMQLAGGLVNLPGLRVAHAPVNGAAADDSQQAHSGAKRTSKCSQRPPTPPAQSGIRKRACHQQQQLQHQQQHQQQQQLRTDLSTMMHRERSDQSDGGDSGLTEQLDTTEELAPTTVPISDAGLGEISDKLIGRPARPKTPSLQPVPLLVPGSEVLQIMQRGLTSSLAQCELDRFLCAQRLDPLAGPAAPSTGRGVSSLPPAAGFGVLWEVMCLALEGVVVRIAARDHPPTLDLVRRIPTTDSGQEEGKLGHGQHGKSLLALAPRAYGLSVAFPPLSAPQHSATVVPEWALDQLNEVRASLVRVCAHMLALEWGAGVVGGSAGRPDEGQSKDTMITDSDSSGSETGAHHNTRTSTSTATAGADGQVGPEVHSTSGMDHLLAVTRRVFRHLPAAALGCGGRDPSRNPGGSTPSSGMQGETGGTQGSPSHTLGRSAKMECTGGGAGVAGQGRQTNATAAVDPMERFAEDRWYVGWLQACLAVLEEAWSPALDGGRGFHRPDRAAAALIPHRHQPTRTPHPALRSSQQKQQPALRLDESLLAMLHVVCDLSQGRCFNSNVCSGAIYLFNAAMSWSASVASQLPDQAADRVTFTGRGGQPQQQLDQPEEKQVLGQVDGTPPCLYTGPPWMRVALTCRWFFDRHVHAVLRPVLMYLHTHKCMIVKKDYGFASEMVDMGLPVRERAYVTATALFEWMGPRLISLLQDQRQSAAPACCHEPDTASDISEEHQRTSTCGSAAPFGYDKVVSSVLDGLSDRSGYVQMLAYQCWERMTVVHRPTIARHLHDFAESAINPIKRSLQQSKKPGKEGKMAAAVLRAAVRAVVAGTRVPGYAQASPTFQRLFMRVLETTALCKMVDEARNY